MYNNEQYNTLKKTKKTSADINLCIVLNEYYNDRLATFPLIHYNCENFLFIKSTNYSGVPLVVITFHQMYFKIFFYIICNFYACI